MDLKKLAAMAALLAVSGVGQTGVGQTAFTVSSVRPSVAGKGGGGKGNGKGDLSTSPVMLTIRNLSLDKIIAAAYGVEGYQVSGPRWLAEERFDIIGKTDAPVGGEDEMRPLLQGLLAERFRLALHRETKELPGYALTVAKNGPKLEAATAGGADLPSRKANKTGGTKIDAAHLTMQQLAEILSRRLGRPVQDRTGLAGPYRVRLEWAAEAPAPKPGRPDKTKPTRDLPTIFTALKDQMGLRLDARKAPGEIFVVDHIDRTPIAN